MMDVSHADICKVHITAEIPECFICRDVQLVDGEPLRRFCDCKNLVAHHHCLLTWVRTGLESEEQLRCRVCNAEYQQRRAGLWRTVASQWHTWLVTTAFATLVVLVPYLVYRMLTTFDSPPPHTLFKMASICFGILSETLLLRLLQCFVTNRYRHARQTSFSLQPRSPAEEQEAGVKGHDHQADALWPRKSCAAVEKAKQIDSQ